MGKANTEDDNLTTCGNCISYEDWFRDAENECFISKPVVQHVDPGFSEAMFYSMTSVKTKWVAGTPKAQNQVDHVAVNVERVLRG